MAKGEINTTPLDTLTWSASEGRYPRYAEVTTGIYAIAYRGPTGYVYVCTISVGTDGALALVDTQQIESTGCSDAQGRPLDIAKKGTSDIYVVAWCSTDSVDGFVATVEIDSSGNISTVKDTWEYQPTGGQVPSLCHISGDVMAILFRDNGADGYIWTFSVADNGTITKSAISSWEFDTTEGQGAIMRNVSGTTYVVGYNRGYAASHIFTCTIANDGTITKSKIDTLDFDNQTASPNGGAINIIDCGDTYFTIVHTAGSAVSSRAEAVTCTIAANGTISNSWIDTQAINSADGRWTDGVVAEGLLVATYDQSVTSDGCHIKTYSIADGVIGSNIDSHEFEPDVNDTHTRLVRPYAEIYVVIYYGSGIAKSYSISEKATLQRLFRLLKVYQKVKI